MPDLNSAQLAILFVFTAIFGSLLGLFLYVGSGSKREAVGGFFAVAAVFGGITVAGTHQAESQDRDVRMSWDRTEAWYDMDVPAGVAAPGPKDQPVPVRARVHGKVAACQAVYAERAVEVTCAGVEADRR